MKLSSSLVQDITEEIKSIINQDINYFNKEAYIVASTNKERIGDFHEGARKVLDTKEDLVIEYDNQYEGAKKGINLPVYFMEDVVGVIGITGHKEEVEHYGKIIQKMTELMIKDAYLQEKKFNERENREKFLEELLFNKENRKSIDMWAELLDIKVEKEIAIVITNIWKKDSSLVEVDSYNSVLATIEDHFSYNKKNILMKSGKNILIACHTKNIDNLESKVRRIERVLKKDFKELSLLFVLGNTVDNLHDLKKSYYQAYKTMEIANNFSWEGVFTYQQLDLELLIDSIGETTGKIYLDKIFKEISRKDIEKYRKNFMAYIDYNGSIGQASKNLYIHKNTLQYRLDKIYEETSYNPRVLEDMIILYLAFTLDKYLENKLN